jgi:hypothetical protein
MVKFYGEVLDGILPSISFTVSLIIIIELPFVWRTKNGSVIISNSIIRASNTGARKNGLCRNLNMIVLR